MYDTPRHQCATYISDAGNVVVEQLTKVEFNKLCRNGAFEDGPFSDSFGDGYGEPYNPWRQAFGRLKDGRVVWTELSEQ